MALRRRAEVLIHAALLSFSGSALGHRILRQGPTLQPHVIFLPFYLHGWLPGFLFLSFLSHFTHPLDLPSNTGLFTLDSPTILSFLSAISAFIDDSRRPMNLHFRFHSECTV